MPGGIQGQGSAPTEQIAQFRSDGASAQSGLRIPFFSDDFARSFGMPSARIKNMITEATPLREERPYVAYVGLREVRYSRPGLVTGFNYGTGPIRGVFYQPGCWGGAVFIVSGTTIYKNGVSVGTLPGTDLVRFATSPAQLVAIANGGAYVYDGVTYTAFTQILSASLPPVNDVAYLAGRFAYVAVNSATWWYSEIFDATNVLGLDFASNELSPANTLAVAVLNDELAFFGQDVTEFWSPGSDASAPFTPNQGRGFQRGIASRDTLRFADNALVWLGNNGVVYRSGNVPDRISSNAIEDRIRQCANLSACTAFVATFEGHEFYVLNVYGVGTYAYDFSRIGAAEGAYGDSYARGEWAEWTSFNHPGGFRGRVSATVGTQVYVGDDTTNDVWAMTVGAYSDGSAPLTRQVSAFIKVEEGSPRCDSLVLHCVTGVGNAVAPGNAPIVEMRYSDDMGRTFKRWKAGYLQAQGVYGKRVTWQRLGQMRAPGRLVEIRCSDPVDVAFSHLELNPARPVT